MGLLEEQILATVILQEAEEEIRETMLLIVETYSKPDTKERGYLQALLLSLLKLSMSATKLQISHEKLLKNDQGNT